MQEKIAKIRGTFLGYQDHGILTAQLELAYGPGGGEQFTPGYFCDEYLKETDERRGTDFGMEFVARLIRAVGVRTWEELKGRTVIALIEDGLVAGIKPLPTEHGEEFIFKNLRTELGIA